MHMIDHDAAYVRRRRLLIGETIVGHSKTMLADYLCSKQHSSYITCIADMLLLPLPLLLSLLLDNLERSIGASELRRESR